MCSLGGEKNEGRASSIARLFSSCAGIGFAFHSLTMRPPGDKSATSPPVLPIVQGVFFVTTGLWPAIHMRSFEAVTGPKIDRWLVKTVGGLIAVVGATLIVGALERTKSKTLPLLGIGAASTLMACDLVYAARGRISPVYLIDAIAEAGLIVGWRRTRGAAS
jgi:hypothetical protein